MDLSSLPDNVFLHIFRFLPLRDQIRVGGVSVAFRRMSDIAISETKSLDLEEVNNISLLGFSRLLNLCQGRLRKCNFIVRVSSGREYHQAMADAFNQYTYPKLTTLRIDSHYNSAIAVSIGNNASCLETLIVQRTINFLDVIMERLVTLDLSCDDRAVQSLTGKMPVLRHLKFRDYGVSYRILDAFLETVPLLESFHVRIESCRRPDKFHSLDLEGNGMTSFWQLKSLNRFEVSYNWLSNIERQAVIIADNALMRIAECFPRLRVLSLCYVRSGKNRVAALSSLRDLRELTLEEVSENIDMGLRELSKCEFLEKLIVTDAEVIDPEGLSVRYFSYFSAVTARTLLRWCPRLSFIACGPFLDIKTREDAVAFITSLTALEKRFNLKFHKCVSESRDIWMSEEVKDAVKKLDEVSGVGVRCRVV